MARFVDGAAQASLSQGDVTAARQLYQRSLSIREKAFGKGNAAIAESLLGMAKCDQTERHSKQAEATFERALSLCRIAEGKYRPPATDVIDDYASFLRATRRQAKAAELEALSRTIKQAQ